MRAEADSPGRPAAPAGPERPVGPEGPERKGAAGPAGLTLAGGEVLTSLNPARIARGDVALADGRVALVGTAPPGGTRLDCGGCLIVPGNACAHTHLYSALARGMPYRLPAPTSFLEILQRVWWRLDRALDEKSVRASALAGGLAALLAGTTTLVDHHASPNAIDGALDVIAEALGELGLRSVLCYEVTDRDGPAGARAGVAENQRFLRRSAAGAFPLARGMVGAHASFTLSADSLGACADLAASAGTGVHIHVAEDATDGSDARARFGTGVVHRLAAAGALTSRSLLAHCVRLGSGEAGEVNASGAMVAHNCRSNLSNGVGRAPVRDLARLALGTDGIDADMFAESQAAYLRLREDDVLASPAWAVARLAEGARFAGAAFGEPALGSIAPGAPADLVVLGYAPPTPLTAANVVGHWAFGLHVGLVRDVVAGERVLADGAPTRVDAGQLLGGARSAAAALWEQMAGIEPHRFAPGGSRVGQRGHGEG